jgi:hypothetical protein
MLQEEFDCVVEMRLGHANVCIGAQPMGIARVHLIESHGQQGVENVVGEREIQTVRVGQRRWPQEAVFAEYLVVCCGVGHIVQRGQQRHGHTVHESVSNGQEELAYRLSVRE